ncbi:MAG: TRAP transporter small permease [Aquimonas sp.]|jgi:TRAP-type C4-dicarboxylate transport system permease small subunit
MSQRPLRMGTLDRTLEPIAHAATVLSSLGLFGMVLTQGWQVLARYALNASPSWTEPLTLICLTTTLAFGAAAGVHARSHFRFPLLVMLLPETGQRALARLSALVVIGVGLLLAVFGLQLGLDGLAVRMAGAPLPQSSAYFPLAAGGALMSLFALPQLLRAPLENA